MQGRQFVQVQELRTFAYNIHFMRLIIAFLVYIYVMNKVIYVLRLLGVEASLINFKGWFKSRNRN
jgi:hypothetical protein